MYEAITLRQRFVPEHNGYINLLLYREIKMINKVVDVRSEKIYGPMIKIIDDCMNPVKA